MTATLDATAGVDVADRAVSAALAAGADHAQVSHVYSELFEITYDNTDIGMVRTTVDDQISMTVFVNGAKGQSSLTGRSNDLVDKAAAEAVAAARSGMSDSANAIFEGESSDLTELGDREPQQENMLDAIVRHQAFAAEHYPSLILRDSTYEFSNRWRSFANSSGLRRQERRGAYTHNTIFSGKDGERSTSFNYTHASSVEPFGELRDAATLRQLFDDALASFDPRPVPATFVGDVIFTPDSLSTLLGAVLQSLSGYTLMKGTSPFQESLGEVIADTRLSVTNSPRSPKFPLSSGFDGDGVPSIDLPIIDKGVLAGHVIDWYTSRKLDRPMTSSGNGLDVAPGDQTYEEIIANTEKGIVLGRFSGGMPNQQLDFSGVAKNSFYVENGKIQFPINETMIAGNFCELLRSIRAIGSTSVNFGGHAFPAVATTGVTISTK